MKTLLLSLTSYSIHELKEMHPQGYSRALDKHRDECSEEIPWQSEIFESLKGLYDAAGVRMKKYSLGICNRSNGITAEFSGDYSEETADLCGKRAMAWLENNLLSSLRIPWKGERRDEVRKYGKYYRPGMVKPCPFTGYCADDSFLESLLRDIRKGDTLREAFESLADEYVKLLESEDENQRSEEYFLDRCDCDDATFDEDGERLE